MLTRPPGSPLSTSGTAGRRTSLAGAALVVCMLAFAAGVTAQPADKRISTDGPSWSTLSSSQRKALQPLERDWNGIEGSRKTKWLEIAAKFEKLSPPEQARVQERMSDWTRLSPKERGEVRQNFKDAQQVPDRKAAWESYNALSPDARKELAERAKPQPTAQAKRRDDVASRKNDGVAPKSNIVPNSAAARPRTVAPAVAQAQPGATTNLISKRPSPPAHQQPGLPKIAASPGFVDQTTLLPKRGAQSAGTRSAAAATEPPSSRP
jgi:hypothetical protein